MSIDAYPFQVKTKKRYDLIVIGASLGGLNALQSILGSLKESFSLPVVTVIHRKDGYESDLVHLIQKHSKIRVVEAEDKQNIEAATVYIAPAGYHLLVNGDHLLLSVDEQVHYARPSIDVLFDTAAFSKKEKLAGIILTGSGKDGIWGLKQVQIHGGYTIVQDPEEAECGMLSKGAMDELKPDQVLSIESIALFLNSLMG